jgi:hypothetical protein
MRIESRRWLAPALAAAMLAFAAGAARASAQALLEPARVELAVRGAQAAPDAAAMRRVILGAAQARGWQLTLEAPGSLRLHVASREHEATIDVLYDAAGFQIRYRTSAAMDYEVDGGRTFIHPRYNKWVTELSNEIRRGARDAVPQRRRQADAGQALPGADAASDAGH